MASLDLIEERVRQQRVKVPLVKDKENCIQVVGRTKIEGPANLSFVDGHFKSADGKVTVKLVLSKREPELLSTTIVADKIMNTGVVYADLLISSHTGVLLASQSSIPIIWHDVLSSPSAEPGDIIQKHDFQVLGFENVTGYCDCDGTFWLVLAVVIRYCLVLASERILRVEAAETFC